MGYFLFGLLKCHGLKFRFPQLTEPRNRIDLLNSVPQNQKSIFWISITVISVRFSVFYAQGDYDLPRCHHRQNDPAPSTQVPRSLTSLLRTTGEKRPTGMSFIRSTLAVVCALGLLTLIPFKVTRI